MKYALRLTGTERDLAALHTLTLAAEPLIEAPWTVLSAPSSKRSLLLSARLDIAVAQQLHARGLDVVRTTRRGASLALSPMQGPGEAKRWDDVTEREAPSLVEALRPVRLRGDLGVD